MALLTKKILSLLLVLLIVINSTAFSFAQDSESDIETKVEDIKESQEATQKKFAKVVGKADQIIDGYKQAVAAKGESYVKRNEYKIKKTLKKASNLKLKLIDTANEVLKQDLENKIEKNLEGEISEAQIEQIKKETEPDYLFELQEAPSDTVFGSQWGLQNIFSGNYENALSYEGEKVVVAVLDTGVNFSLPDLQSKAWNREICKDSEGNDIPGGCNKGGYDFVDNDNDPFPNDDYSHGTQVASIIGANTNNNEGIASIANENVEIMSLRACCGQGNFFGANNIAKAIRFAANNDADIINASFGGPTDSIQIREAIEYANEKGVTIVAAAGNYSSNNDVNPMFPANYNIPNIVSVGAISNNETLSYFSNYGKEEVDIAAPGSLVYALDINGNPKAINGTSFATPFVTSTLARYKSENPSFSASELKNTLFSNSAQNTKLEGYIGGGYQLKFPTEQPPSNLPLSVEDENSEEVTENIPSEETPITENNFHSELRDSYIKIMRSVSNIRTGNISIEPNKDSLSLQEIKNLETEIQELIDSEKENLETIYGLESEKINDYIGLLEKQKSLVANYNAKIHEAEGSETVVLSSLSKEGFTTLSNTALTELGVEAQEPKIQILDDMSSFDFGDEEIELQNVTSYEAIETNIPGSGITTFSAEENPVSLNDLQGNSEVIIDETIEKLASELEYNPVKILNYVRDNIVYEPYSGVKKTSLQCLQTSACNDVDTSSLLIALLRASDIPARYSSSAILVKKENLAKLLGTTDIQTVSNILGRSKVQPYTINEDEENLIIDWTFVELLSHYDYRRGNYTHTNNFNDIESNEVLIQRVNELGNLEWIRVDATFDFNTLSGTESIAQKANTDIKSFFYNHLQADSQSAVLPSFRQSLIDASAEVTAENIESLALQKDEVSFGNIEFLPVSFAYTLIEGTGENGKVFEKTSFSSVSEAQKQKIIVKLKKYGTNEIVLEQSFFVSELDNTPLTLDYRGATETDQNVIDSYGSLHLTPSSLVDIIPVLSLGEPSTQNSVKIGDQLVLSFDYYINGNLENSNAKFATAGNSEGLYFNFSRISEDSLDTDSKVLLAGNWAIAKRYLERVQDAGDELAGLFGRSYNPVYTRAIVTQNRVLNTVDDTITTFDFKGLSIDAYNYVNDYALLPTAPSNTADFRMVYGLYASEQEGQIFDDITGLTGISTVRGLQFAYENSDVYSISRIDSANRSDIDSLGFSENTKSVMRQYVDEGKVIVTPNTSVQNQAWQGIVYVAVDESNGDGIYAIGEMVANGGWTIDKMTNFFEGEETDEIIADLEHNGDYFIYDEVGGNKTMCNIAKTDASNIFTYEDYTYANHGLPCAYQEYEKQLLYNNEVGNYNHSFTLFTKAANFKSVGRNDGDYNSWKEEEGFEADLDLGTYVKKEDSIFTYEKWHVYNPKSETTYLVPSDVLSKYKEKRDFDNKKVYEVIGFPINDGENINRNIKPKEVYYQKFENGGLYSYERFLNDKEVYSFGNIYKHYENNGGLNGKYGTILKDPEVNSSLVSQTFEDNIDIRYNNLGEIYERDHITFACGVGNNNNIVVDPFLYGFGIEVKENIEGIPEGIAFLGQLQEKLSPFNLITKAAKFATDPQAFNELMLSALDLNETDSTDEFVNYLSENNIPLSNEQNEIVQAYNEIKYQSNCSARKAYLSGRITGFGATFIVGGGAATKAPKVSSFLKFTKINKGTPLKKLVPMFKKFQGSVTDIEIIKKAMLYADLRGIRINGIVVIPKNYIRKPVPGGKGYFYINPSNKDKTIRVMKEGRNIDKPHNLNKPYFKIETIIRNGDGKKIFSEFSDINGNPVTKFEDVHILINNITF